MDEEDEAHPPSTSPTRRSAGGRRRTDRDMTKGKQEESEETNEKPGHRGDGGARARIEAELVLEPLYCSFMDEEEVAWNPASSCEVAQSDMAFVTAGSVWFSTGCPAPVPYKSFAR